MEGLSDIAYNENIIKNYKSKKAHQINSNKHTDEARLILKENNIRISIGELDCIIYLSSLYNGKMNLNTIPHELIYPNNNYYEIKEWILSILL